MLSLSPYYRRKNRRLTEIQWLVQSQRAVINEATIQIQVSATIFFLASSYYGALSSSKYMMLSLLAFVQQLPQARTILSTMGDRKLNNTYLQSSLLLVKCMQYTYEVLFRATHEWRLQPYSSFQWSRESPVAAIVALQHLRVGSAWVANVREGWFLMYSKILYIYSKYNGKKSNNLNEDNRED